MGRYGGRKGFHSAPAILGVIGRGRLARYLGIIGVLIPLAVYFYYVLVESWCLAYCYEYFKALFGQGGLAIDTGASLEAQTTASRGFYDEFTGRNFDGVMLDGRLHESVVFWAITFAVNVWFVYRGLSKGIEAFCKWAMPAMAVCALIVLVRVLTLPANPAAPEQNVVSGLGFMWNPDFRALGNAQTWLAAAGQIFFSLSVGFGVIINYASYLRKKDDVVLSGLTASATNELFEVGFGGMITIPAAFIFLGATGTIAAASSGTFGLGFTTLPVVFAQMPLGNLVGAVWFFMLFLAAITSSLSMLQPAIAFVEEALGSTRKLATTVITIVCVIGSLWVIWFSQGSVAMSTIDDWVGTFLIVVLAAVQVICFGWVFGVDRGLEEAHRGAQLRIPGFMRFIIKYIAPAYLLTAIFMFCRNNILSRDGQAGWLAGLQQNPVARNTLILVGLVVVGLCVLTYVGEKRWRAAGLDVDGERPPEEGSVALAQGGAKR
jgi:SNF family Na+-dependent transporter